MCSGESLAEKKNQKTQQSTTLNQVFTSFAHDLYTLCLMLQANYNWLFLLLKCRIFTYCSEVFWLVFLMSQNMGSAIRPRLQLMYSSFSLWNPHYIENMSWVNKAWLSEAIEQAKQGLSEGGLPIGSVLVDPQSGEVTHQSSSIHVKYSLVLTVSIL